MRSLIAAVFAAVVFAATIFTLVAAAGFLSEQSSTLQLSADARGAHR